MITKTRLLKNFAHSFSAGSWHHKGHFPYIIYSPQTTCNNVAQGGAEGHLSAGIHLRGRLLRKL